MKTEKTLDPKHLEALRACLEADPTRKKFIDPADDLLPICEELERLGHMSGRSSFVLKGSMVKSVRIFRVTAAGARAAA